MYYVPDGTKVCGYYECKKCGNRFLSLEVKNKIPCRSVRQRSTMRSVRMNHWRIFLETAKLKEKIEGEEEVEQMDALLSLAVTGGDFNWI